MNKPNSAFWRDKQAIITGGGGFVGREVAAQLQKLGCSHIFVPSHHDYDLSTETDVLRAYADAAKVRPATMSFIVFHIAGLNGGIGANKARPADFYYQNAAMNLLVLHHAWQAGAYKAIATGAGNGYPINAPNPLREETLWDGFPQPESAGYALAKRMMHIHAMTYWQQHHFAIIVALLGNVYGPHDNFDPATAPVVSALIRRFVDAVTSHQPEIAPWGTGKATRDFIYVGDVAEGLILAAEKIEQSEVINLSSGQDTSIREVVELLQHITGYRGKIAWDTSKPDGASSRRFDMSKTQQLLNWQSSTPLSDGLKHTIEWYQHS